MIQHVYPETRAINTNTAAAGISISFRVIVHIGSSAVCLAMPAVRKLSSKRVGAASTNKILQCIHFALEKYHMQHTNI